ncbi:MAG: hypothetical protein ACR2HN_08395 [Tepidiformaceae bacterium]
MDAAPHYPQSASIYEVLRTRPGARERLTQAGLTPDLFDHRIGDAAAAVGLPVERLAQLVASAEVPAP